MAVEELYSKIKTDSRLTNLKKLHDQSSTDKLFSSWLMKFAPFNNIEWSDQEFDSGNFLNIQPEGAIAVFHSVNKFINN